MSLLSIELTKDEFSKIVRLAKALGEYVQFLKGVTLSCNNCGVFIVKAPALLTMLVFSSGVGPRQIIDFMCQV